LERKGDVSSGSLFLINKRESRRPERKSFGRDRNFFSKIFLHSLLVRGERLLNAPEGTISREKSQSRKNFFFLKRKEGRCFGEEKRSFSWRKITFSTAGKEGKASFAGSPSGGWWRRETCLSERGEGGPNYIEGNL